MYPMWFVIFVVNKKSGLRRSQFTLGEKVPVIE